VKVVVNGEERGSPDGSTVTDLLEHLGLGARWVLVERNGEPVERASFEITSLSEGDRLEVVRAVAGG